LSKADKPRWLTTMLLRGDTMIVALPLLISMSSQ
jgi:hypothetical protein